MVPLVDAEARPKRDVVWRVRISRPDLVSWSRARISPVSHDEDERPPCVRSRRASLVDAQAALRAIHGVPKVEQAMLAVLLVVALALFALLAANAPPEMLANLEVSNDVPHRGSVA